MTTKTKTQEAIDYVSTILDDGSLRITHDLAVSLMQKIRDDIKDTEVAHDLADRLLLYYLYEWTKDRTLADIYQDIPKWYS